MSSDEVVSPETPCFVCAKHALGDRAPGGVLYQDDLVYAGHVFMNGQTAYCGHLVVEPRRHVEGFGFLSDDEAGRLGSVANQLAAVLLCRIGQEPLAMDVAVRAVPPAGSIAGGAAPPW